MILECACSNMDLQPPPVPKDLMREMLHVWTTETIFRRHNGYPHKQVDGVAMRSSLSPSFANYYMGNLETQVIISFSPDLITVVYCRYEDDVFRVIHRSHVLYSLKDLFESKSLLISHMR